MCERETDRDLVKRERERERERDRDLVKRERVCERERQIGI